MESGGGAMSGQNMAAFFLGMRPAKGPSHCGGRREGGERIAGCACFLRESSSSARFSLDPRIRIPGLLGSYVRRTRWR
jgi:hypothetical protein